jgi:perosamine synthetase
MNYLAPSGTPINFSHILKWISSNFQSQEVFETFSQKIKDAFNVKHCLFVSSGRTALYLLLQCLYELNNDSIKNQVIIPSYTCYSVPGSIVKANLKVRVCDINPATLSYDLDQLSQFDFSKVLAIITSNLYGIPYDLPSIENIAREHNVYLIDDAAQSMRAKVAGRFSGTYGDVGLYSLDKGKNITSIQGGIIVTDSDLIAESMNKIIQSLPKQSILNIIEDCIKLLVYASLLPPNRYWIITKMPFLGLGLTPYTTNYPVHQYSKTMGKIASLLFDELSDITQSRISNAQNLRNTLINLPGLKMIEFNKNVEPVYLRFPLLIQDNFLRNQLTTELNKAGIGATQSYPTSILNINQLKPKLIDNEANAKGGKLVAEQILTLPTHPFMQPAHIEKIRIIFRSIMT